MVNNLKPSAYEIKKNLRLISLEVCQVAEFHLSINFSDNRFCLVRT